MTVQTAPNASDAFYYFSSINVFHLNIKTSVTKTPANVPTVYEMIAVRVSIETLRKITGFFQSQPTNQVSIECLILRHKPTILRTAPMELCLC